MNKAINLPPNAFVAAGLMSGTSMDGIDGSLIVTDGECLIKNIDSYSLDYQPDFKALLKSCEDAVKGNVGDLDKARRTFENKHTSIKFDSIIDKSTDLHAQVINELLKKTG